MTPTHAAPRTTGLEPAFLHAAVQERITNLWFSRQIFRKLCGADWPTARRETEVELRALLRLARAARHAAEDAVIRDSVWRVDLRRDYRDETSWTITAPESADPLTAGKGYHDWQAQG